MINSLYELNENMREKLSHSHCGMRIISLFNAYGGSYDFCMFYETDCGILCSFYSTITYFGGTLDDETLAFILLNSPMHIETPLQVAESIDLQGYNRIKRYCFEFSSTEASKHIQFESKPDLHKVYDIVSRSFSLDIGEDIWFADMSHKVRHEVSKVYRYKDTVAVNDYKVGNKAYFSQVSTSPETRGKGTAKALLTAIAEELKENNIQGFLFAEERLCPFYEKVGFKNTGYEYCFEREV